ncbi:MAG: AAA family ATPase, partial [Pseudomonadota bacterium]|nr:AAA family ATPase [Pseudomonadota bacterium]
MSLTSDVMELREEEIAKHLEAALGFLDGFDHAPRVARATTPARAEDRSPGLGARRRFRSTTPGLVTRREDRPEGVHLIDRVGDCDGADPLISTRQAAVLQALRRALAVGLALGEGYAEQTGLTDLKRRNLEGALAADRRTEFAELLAAEALIVL